MDFSNYFSNLKKVNLDGAVNGDSLNFHRLTELSGLFLLTSHIDAHYHDSDYFIDLSFVSGSIEGNGLPDFLYVKNKSKYFDIESIRSKYHSLYEHLKNNGIGPYYDKGFFFERQETDPASFYTYETINNESISEIARGDNRISFQSNEDSNLFVSNVSLPEFSYHDYLDKLKEEESGQLNSKLNMFHTYLKKYFLKSGKAVNTLLLAFPIIAAQKVKTNETDCLHGQGALFIFFASADNIKIKENLLFDLGKICKDISYNYIFSQAERLSKRLKKESIKSAKAAIMGRNMSHNIGSHVIYYLRQHLSGDITHLNEVLQNLKIDEHGVDCIRLSLGDDNTNAITIKKSDLDLSFLNGLGTFLTYIQERQDFIAALSSDYKPAFSSANFKSFVIDNFCKDLRAKRHRSNNDSKQEINILLKYIAKSEDTNIKIKFNDSDLDSEQALDKSAKIHNFSVELPGSTLGRQAIYSILENIIRNAAKHGKRKVQNTDLVLNIQVLDHYGFTKKQQTLLAKENREKWEEDFYQIKITDNNNNSPGLDSRIQKSIQAELIDKNGKLIENEKGIKEIVISALWLNGLNITDISNQERLKYVDVELNKDNELSYIIYVAKSKKVIFIIGDDTANLIDIGLKEIGSIKKGDVLSRIDEISRYDLVVDLVSLSDNDSPSKLSNKFRRYLNINNTENSNLVPAFFEEESGTTYINLIRKYILGNEANKDKLYLIFYHLYIKQNFFKDEEFPKIALTVNDRSSNNNNVNGIPSNLNYYKDKFVDYNANEHSIGLNDDIYYDKKLAKKERVIAYRRHINSNVASFFNESSDTFLKQDDSNKYITLLKKTFENYLSVESITGDNSSYRIIVNETINDLWALKKIEAAAVKVLVIDERLYDNNVYLIEGGLANEQKEDIRKELSKFFTNPEDAEEILKQFNYDLPVDRYNSLITAFYEARKVDDLGLSHDDNRYICEGGISPQDKCDITNKVIGIVKNKTELKRNTQKTLLNRLRSIHIATLNGSSLYDDFHKDKGEFLFDESEKKFKLNLNEDEVFNFISIHQGIIDKLFNLSDERTNEAKTKYVGQIVEQLQKSFNTTKVVVHTGRGRPNYIKGIAPYRSLSDLDYALSEPKEILLNYFEAASYET